MAKRRTRKNHNELLELEPNRKMMQRFVFLPHGNYAGRLSLSQDLVTGLIWATSISVNLAAIRNQKNNMHGAIPIKDDNDAIDRVLYNLNHEWLHYAMHKCGHHVGIEQERMIYEAIGNGGSEFFNKYYNIPIKGDEVT